MTALTPAQARIREAARAAVAAWLEAYPDWRSPEVHAALRAIPGFSQACLEACADRDRAASSEAA